MASKKQPAHLHVPDAEALLEPHGCNLYCHLTHHVHRPPKNKPIIWVLGGPGVGKGTQCHKIVAKYGFTHLSTGDLLRAEAVKPTPKGKFIDEIIERGDLVPNDIVINLLRKAIRDKIHNAKGFLIDGYPREEHQGAEFEKTIAPCDSILYFEASEETLRSRLMGRAENAAIKRIDDTPLAIEHRLRTFMETSNMILGQYPDKFMPIDAERHPDEIFKDVRVIIDPIITLKDV